MYGIDPDTTAVYSTWRMTYARSICKLFSDFVVAMRSFKIAARILRYMGDCPALIRLANFKDLR